MKHTTCGVKEISFNYQKRVATRFFSIVFVLINVVYDAFVGS